MSTYGNGRPTPPLAVEFGTTSISSANYDEYTTLDTVKMIEQAFLSPNLNPHLKYLNLKDHGYMLLELTPEQARCAWYFVDKVKSPSEKEWIGKEIFVQRGRSFILH